MGEKGGGNIIVGEMDFETLTKKLNIAPEVSEYIETSSDIYSEYNDFKSKIIYENRFFNSNHPFLKRIARYIQLDQDVYTGCLNTTIESGFLLYRAREFDTSLETKTVSLIQASIECLLLQTPEKSPFTNEYSDVLYLWHKNLIKDILQFKKSKVDPFRGHDSDGSFVIKIEDAGKVSDMRANPKYIRYLYAAGDEYTSIIETRPVLNSLVSVATIKVTNPLYLFDLTKQLSTDENDPEISTTLFCLRSAFSTPTRGDLSEYLPAQILAEYIKCYESPVKYDGICFNSSLNQAGKNYTIFNFNKCEPISSEIYTIGDVSFSIHGLSTDNKVILDKSNPSNNTP